MDKNEITAGFFAKFPSIKSRVLGKTGFTVSICGFGSYRVDSGVKSHENALKKALLSGINIIDTSSNYSDGGSEKLIGKVLADLVDEEKILRDEIVVVTKGGYIQGNNLRLAVEREQNGKPFPEIVKCAPDLWHCIHPEFLEDQISRSLNRLQTGSIDVYLLHNPEYFLSYSQISEQERREKEYYRRIKEAFIHLESEVRKGRISYYGISSNTFGIPSAKPNFTSLEKVIEIANSISSDNHFAVVQFPLNLFEQGGMHNKNCQNNEKSFLQFAYENKLGVLVNRPLNAIVKNQLIRLADYPVTENRNESEITELIDDLSRQEKVLIEKYVNYMSIKDSERSKLIEYLSLGRLLKNNISNFSNPGNFKEVKGYHLIPRANYAINSLGKQFSDENAVHALRNYAVTINILMESIYSNIASKQNAKNSHIHKKLDSFLNENQRKLTLSQKAVLIINSLENVTATLVGMRSTEYVDDIIGSIYADYIYEPVSFWNSDFRK